MVNEIYLAAKSSYDDDIFDVKTFREKVPEQKWCSQSNYKLDYIMQIHSSLLLTHSLHNFAVIEFNNGTNFSYGF